MSNIILPADAAGAEIKLQELRGRRVEAMDKLSDFLDTRGNALTKADDEIAARLEARVDSIDEDIKAVTDRFPQTRGPSFEELRKVALGPDRSIDIDTGEDATAPAGVMVRSVEHTEGRTFEGASPESFSLGRMVRGAVTGEWGDADLEQRAMSISTNADGGFAVPSLLAAEVIDRVTTQARAIEAGVRVVPMDGATLAFPRITTGVTGSWVAENAAISESQPVLDRVTLSAKKLAVMCKVSRELLEDITEAGAQAITDEITRAISLQLDSAVFSGAGSGSEPQGIRGASGVTTSSTGTNGASPTYAQIASAVSTIRQANLEPTAAIVHPRTAGLLDALFDSTGQPLRKSPGIERLPILTTTALPANLTQGTATNTTVNIVGDFRQCLLGVRPTLQVQVLNDGSRYLDTLSVAIVAWLRADVQLAQPSGFVVTTGLKSS